MTVATKWLPSDCFFKSWPDFTEAMSVSLNISSIFCCSTWCYDDSLFFLDFCSCKKKTKRCMRRNRFWDWALFYFFLVEPVFAKFATHLNFCLFFNFGINLGSICHLKKKTPKILQYIHIYFKSLNEVCWSTLSMCK